MVVRSVTNLVITRAEAIKLFHPKTKRQTSVKLMVGKSHADVTISSYHNHIFLLMDQVSWSYPG